MMTNMRMASAARVTFNEAFLLSTRRAPHQRCALTTPSSAPAHARGSRRRPPACITACWPMEPRPRQPRPRRWSLSLRAPARWIFILFQIVLTGADRRDRASSSVNRHCNVYSCWRQPPRSWCCRMLKHCVYLQVDEALAVLQDMAGRGAERSPVAYGALVAAAEKGGRPVLALQLFDDMLRALLKPSAATFSAALAACAQSEHPAALPRSPPTIESRLSCCAVEKPKILYTILLLANASRRITIAASLQAGAGSGRWRSSSCCAAGAASRTPRCSAACWQRSRLAASGNVPSTSSAACRCAGVVLCQSAVHIPAFCRCSSSLLCSPTTAVVAAQ